MVIFIRRLRKIIVVKSESTLSRTRLSTNTFKSVDRNWQEDTKSKEGDSRPEFLHFNPTNRSRDPSFVATTLLPLNPDDPDSFAGIPLGPEVLSSTEHENIFECNSIGLTFRSPESRKTFSDTYRDLWKEWYRQTKAAEQQPGYTPVPAPARRDYAPGPAVSKPASRPHPWKLPRPPSMHAPKTSGLSTKETVRPMAHRGGNRGGSR